MSDANSEAGFSTLEMLAAFVVLSLGLAIAVQTVGQATLSVRRAGEGRAELALVEKLRAEEVRKLRVAYRGSPLIAEGPAWRLELRPFRDGEPDGPIRATLRIETARGVFATHVDILPPLSPTEGAFAFAPPGIRP